MTIGKIYITDVIGVDTKLLDVIRQVKSQKNSTEFVAIIDSVGGYVDEGYAIADYLKNLSVPVSTYAKKAYSIASVIFMAGQRRIVDEGADDVVMIHLPWMETVGNYNEIIENASELKEVENGLVKFYSDQLEVDKATIQSLLAKETYLNSTEALDMGIATELKTPQNAMAKLQINNKDQESTWMNKAEKILNRIAKNLGIKAELVLQDANSIELVFVDLSEGDTPEAGAKATVDGKPAEGDFVMPDGSTMSFESGELKAITPAADPSENAESENSDEGKQAEGEPSVDKDARIAELEKENEELKAKIAELEAVAQPDETQDKLLKIIEASTKKIVDLETNYNALAKSIGSDFNPDTKKETNPSVKASAEAKSRAWQILNA
jgi:ATP-dependent protease ClpP protease subunit